jgi:lipopolysaccharide transport system ATP-binding protein
MGYLPRSDAASDFPDWQLIPTMSDDILIKVEGASKKFCRDLKRSLWYGVQDTARDLSGRDANANLRRDEFWAVDDVSFELRRGDCLGLIGRNGAGKTTLLKMLNGLIKPDRGRIEMRGRIGALIALGAGFNPILSGRENIYVNGSVLGLSRREIDAKLDDIIGFADISEFIDTPVQSYSSGMQVRLGFAVATALDPDILLLDEVLAVGDAAFRIRCHRRISEMQKKAAVIFVSHEMAYVARICNRALVLAHGQVQTAGDPATAIESYNLLNDGNQEPEEQSYISHHWPVTSFEVISVPREASFGSPFAIEMRLDSAAQIKGASFRASIYNRAGAIVADCVMDSKATIGAGKTRSRVEISSLPLKAGRYRLSMSIADAAGEFVAVSHKGHDIVVTGGHLGTVADCQLNVRSWSHANVSEGSYQASVAEG